MISSEKPGLSDGGKEGDIKVQKTSIGSQSHWCISLYHWYAPKSKKHSRSIGSILRRSFPLEEFAIAEVISVHTHWWHDGGLADRLGLPTCEGASIVSRLRVQAARMLLAYVVQICRFLKVSEGDKR
ncbi:hypothetical protein GOP47_0013148 [Adiantum capillus-veneris]|uniref:Uncharacterized protein n=1 Tax=Adiantum capillus-veneris TaxID=13818 RepID=A0A9D4ZE96_ADICA|nr:hypothetical protein GOP47_0013148 [Adiantum capillus-veneris]